MSGENIFISLSLYSPSLEANPKENHFTEAFSFLVSKQKPLLKTIIKQVLEYKGRDSKLIEKMDCNKMEIRTQVENLLSGKKTISDIQISTDEFVILIENKIDSKEGEDEDGNTQLEKYIKLLDIIKGKRDGYLFYITLNPEDVKRSVELSEYFIHITWSEMFDFLNEYTKNITNETDKWILSQFLEYMKCMGMGSFEGFKQDELEAWLKMDEFDKGAEKLLNEVKRLLITLKYDGIELKRSKEFRYIEFAYKNFRKSEAVGYIGLYKWQGNDPGYINYPRGVYCFVDFKAKGNVAWTNDSQPRPGQVYFSERTRITYDFMLSDLIGNEKNPEKQIKLILEFYKKGLTAIEKTKEYQNLIRT
jgi:hypothetical protein